MRRFPRIATFAIVFSLILLVAFWGGRHEFPARLSAAHWSGGCTRTWMAYVPVKPQAHPALMIALQSSMGTAEQARHVYGYDFDLFAEEHGCKTNSSCSPAADHTLA